MTPGEFAQLSHLVRRRSGLVLTADRKTLAQSRLKPVADRFGFRDCTALLAELPYPSEELAQAIVEAMMTNETSFFRDRTVFDHIAAATIPSLLRARQGARRLRIWCAAAATGQEAYSLAILLDNAALLAEGWRIDLIATDYSEAAIARAESGLYSEFEIERGLLPDLVERYFVAEGGQMRVVDRLRRMVTFRTFNLLDHFGWLGRLDLILCRNVLFYLDPRERTSVHAKLAGAIADDGPLVLGENESIPEFFVPQSALKGVFVKSHAAERRLQRLAV